MTGIRLASGETFQSPQDVQKALQDYWAPVYSDKPFDADAANKFLKVYCNKNQHLFDFAELGLPDYDDFFMTIGKMRDSAPGPDGLPYSAYKACRELAAEIFSNVVDIYTTQDEPRDLESFNRQLVWFAPKSALADDRRAVYRAPDKLRTIFGVQHGF